MLFHVEGKESLGLCKAMHDGAEVQVAALWA